MNLSFRDWFFDRLIWVLMSGEWVIKIKDFKYSKNKRERKLFGLTVPNPDNDGGMIYLDKQRGKPRILIHELGHVVLGDMIDMEARDRNKTTKRIDRWTEDQVMIFERLFYSCLSAKQVSVLKIFIDRAKINLRSNL